MVENTVNTRPELGSMFEELAKQNKKRAETILDLKQIAEFEREVGEQDQPLEEQITREEMREQAIRMALERRGYQ